MYKLVIFDLDGTLIDSMYVWRKIDVDFLAERGLEVPPDYEQAIKTMHFETTEKQMVHLYGHHSSLNNFIANCY